MEWYKNIQRKKQKISDRYSRRYGKLPESDFFRNIYKKSLQKYLDREEIK